MVGTASSRAYHFSERRGITARYTIGSHQLGTSARARGFIPTRLVACHDLLKRCAKLGPERHAFTRSSHVQAEICALMNNLFQNSPFQPCHSTCHLPSSPRFTRPSHLPTRTQARQAHQHMATPGAVDRTASEFGVFAATSDGGDVT